MSPVAAANHAFVDGIVAGEGVSKMTSTCVPQRRIQTQILIPTPSILMVSVEDWEAMAPPFGFTTKGVNPIKAASENITLLPNVSFEMGTYGSIS